MQTKIVRVKDFEVDGAGGASAWRKTNWPFADMLL